MALPSIPARLMGAREEYRDVGYKKISMEYERYCIR